MSRAQLARVRQLEARRRVVADGTEVITYDEFMAMAPREKLRSYVQSVRGTLRIEGGPPVRRDVRAPTADELHRMMPEERIAAYRAIVDG